MFSDWDVNTITGSLTFLEREVNSQGWDTDPHLWGLFGSPSEGALGIEEMPLTPRIWHLSHTMVGADVPAWVTVAVLARELAGDGIAQFDRWLRQQVRTCIGFAYCGEGLDTSRHEHRQDRPADGADGASVAIRALIARDLDGRTYEIVRDRAAPERTTTRVEVRKETASIPASLDLLLASAHGR